jgi:arginase
MSVNTAIELDNLACKVNDLDAECISLWEEIKHIKKCTAINPENIVFMGTRSYEDAELHLIKAAGIKVLFAEDIHTNGIDWALNEIQLHFEHKAQEWYVSFDVDSMDPTVSIGTGTPEADGLTKQEAATTLQFFWNQSQTQLLEITEINPELDTKKPMAEEVCDLLWPLLESTLPQ